MTKEYAIQILREMIPKFARGDTDVKILTAIRVAINSLEERKTGKWVKERYCSCCEWSNEEVYFTSEWNGNYCPNCGAKMEGAEE